MKLSYRVHKLEYTCQDCGSARIWHYEHNMKQCRDCGSNNIEK